MENYGQFAHIAENYRQVQENIAAALARRPAGRGPVRLLAATKTVPAEEILFAKEVLGLDLIGENRTSELIEKYPALEGKIEQHFIGHLQTNKVKQVVGKVALIQSVDRIKLLDAIQAEAKKQGIIQDILLEINVGEEASKSGFALEEIPGLVEKMAGYDSIRVRGLMAIPPISEKPGDNLYFFQKIYQFSVDIMTKKYDNVMVDCLSMGMSDYFADAIACGSTMIRIGSAIFGPRNYNK
jgi:pyridoxal phosphate enzyme (YggS family)